jgi:hypothetical protein
LAAVLRSVVFKAEYSCGSGGCLSSDDWRTVLRALASVVASVIARQDDAEHAHRFFQDKLERALKGRDLGGP